MDTSSLICSLVAFDRPLAQLQAALDASTGDTHELVTLRRHDIAAVLRRYLAGELSEGDLAYWAQLVECREEIEFEPRHEEAVADALLDLAEADAEAPLREIAADLLARLIPRGG